MKNRLDIKGRKPPYWWAITYGIILISFTVFVLLKTFVIKSTQIPKVKDSGVYSNSNVGTKFHLISTILELLH